MSADADAISELFDEISLGAPERAVGFVLWRVLHRYVREVNRALASLQLTHLQFQTLALTAWLGRSGAPASQAEIARAGDVQKMQISNMMKALEQRGLVTRPRSSVDVRARSVAVSPAGLVALRAALPRVIDVQRRLFGEDGLPDGELLRALLRAEQKATDEDAPR
ncbi:MarR family winged helix-turn-helix transcriptional regulator [Mycobacterium sp.]|uniref:MarR family winged helix-turn-helix transcriptional regulator n=1 Tax=Mycobacterium sp. TaxID=1785 RepID=UPI0025D1F56A|nr:MarR family winged helix-turn-helix transcriptional regulator [Mycobacterium sp.]